MPESRTVTSRRERVADPAWPVSGRDWAAPDGGWAEPNAAAAEDERWTYEPDWDLDRLNDPRWAAALGDLDARWTTAGAGDGDYGWAGSPGGARSVSGRRTVTITGHGAEGYISRRRQRPATPSRQRQAASARRRRPRSYERPGFRADRAAMWAVVLCLLVLLAAVASAHGAVMPAHLARP